MVGGTIDVVFEDGSKAAGTLVGANSSYDLAVVKVDKTNLPTVPLGSSAALNVGESGGDVSYIHAIQTDAAINPGNIGLGFSIPPTPRASGPARASSRAGPLRRSYMGHAQRKSASFRPCFSAPPWLGSKRLTAVGAE